MECIFCKISNKDLSSDVVFEDSKVIAFKDIRPKDRVHVLVIPRKHITGLQSVTTEDVDSLGYLMVSVKKVAEKMGVLETGFRVKIHCGRGGGQEVDHLHLHILAK